MRAKRAADPEGMRKKNLEWERKKREADPDGYRARMAAKQRRRRRTSPELVRAEDRERYHNDPAPKRLASRRGEAKRKQRDPEAFALGQRARRAARLERDPAGARAKLRAADSRRRTRERDAPGRGVTPDQWLAISNSTAGLCSYCSRPIVGLEVDHIEPLSTGGAHDVSNIAPCCRSCNRSKGNKALVVWLAKRRAA